jgi:hypothetical protein
MKTANIMIIILPVFILSSCSHDYQNPPKVTINTPIESTLPQLLKLTYTITLTSPTRTTKSTFTDSIQDIFALSICKNIEIPKGKLLFSKLFDGIYSITIGCQEGNGDCDYQVNKIFSYDGFISEATWSPFGNFIIFAADIGSPPLPPNTGGMVSEMRLFEIPIQGGPSTVISSPVGFVSNIDSCKAVDRILYERNQGYDTKIYMVDSFGNGSSFTHNGDSVFKPSCSSSGNDIAFNTIDDNLYIKHVGKNVHTFVSNSVTSKAIWSTDDLLLSYDYSGNESNRGTCFAKTNLLTDNPPVILNPCPFPDIGYGASYSMDGKLLITHLPIDDLSIKYIISRAPTINDNTISVDPINYFFIKRNQNYYSMSWIGDKHTIIIGGNKAVIVNISDMCSEQTIILPIGLEYSDWLPIQ